MPISYQNENICAKTLFNFFIVKNSWNCSCVHLCVCVCVFKGSFGHTHTHTHIFYSSLLKLLKVMESSWSLCTKWVLLPYLLTFLPSFFLSFNTHFMCFTFVFQFLTSRDCHPFTLWCSFLSPLHSPLSWPF